MWLKFDKRRKRQVTITSASNMELGMETLVRCQQRPCQKSAGSGMRDKMNEGVAKANDQFHLLTNAVHAWSATTLQGMPNHPLLSCEPELACGIQGPDRIHSKAL
jgi:hypothetical protein